METAFADPMHIEVTVGGGDYESHKKEKKHPTFFCSEVRATGIHISYIVEAACQNPLSTLKHVWVACC